MTTWWFPLTRPLPFLVCMLLLLSGAPVGADDLPQGVGALPDDPRDALLLAARANGLDEAEVLALAAVPDGSSGFAPAYAGLLAALGLPPAPVPPGLPQPVSAALVPVVDAMTHAVTLRNEAVADLTPADWDRIHRLDAAHRASRAQDDREVLASAWAEGGLPSALDQTRLAAAAYALLDGGLTAAPALRSAASDWTLPPIAMGAGLCVDDGIGVLIVCGPFDDVLTGDHILEIDLGGNDLHATNAGGSGLGILWGGANGLPAALALDLAGDDSYSGSEQVQGVGSTTPGVLLDLAGNDGYGASALDFTFAQGAGNLGGVGVLYDALGDDTYATLDGRHDGDTAWDSQGFGILGGIGILHDAIGQDTYIGGTMTQGVGDFDAVGLLLDTAGDDSYEAVRWSQAFGDGAGLGLLLEGSGSDFYLLWESFGQGAALGGGALLFDAAGHDGHIAFGGRAQGWGGTGPAWKPIDDILTSLGVPLHGSGVVVDLEGEDTWYGSPGCNLCVWDQGTGVGLDTF